MIDHGIRDTPPEPRRTVTARDVAAAAGVSVATVSYAFNRPDRVSSVTRERVLATAASLGYRGPDPSARALRTGRTGRVAMAMTGGATELLGDPAAVAVALGLARALEREGLVLQMGAPGTAPVDGSVLFRTPDVGLTGPVVLADPTGPTACPAATADVEGAATAMARHLRDLGHRSLAVITWPAAGGRLHGARRGWGDAGPLTIISAPTSGRIHGDQSGRAALATGATAVLGLTDALATEALAAAGHRGLSVPRDISVAGIDDLPGADLLGLTTALIPYRPLGELAGSLLARLIIGEPPGAAPCLPAMPVIRRTTGPAPQPPLTFTR